MSEMETLYFGSSVENLHLTKDFTGWEFRFGIEVTYVYRQAKERGEYVYELKWKDGDWFIGNENWYETDDAVLEIMASRGIDKKYFDLVYHKIVKEEDHLYFEDGVWKDIWEDLGFDWEDEWFMRLEVARKLGCKACSMGEGIVILPEYCPEIIPATDPEEEEEE